MISFVDAIVFALFVLFMIFVFGGYHKNKSSEREALREAEESNSKKESEQDKV